MLSLLAVIGMALGGCATSVKNRHADGLSKPAHGELHEEERAETVDRIVEYWIRQQQDRAMLLYIDPAFCARPLVTKLREEGFKIYPKGEPRPPRNSWDSDESVSWTELEVGEIQISGDEAKARVRTIWRGGFLVEDYLLSRRDGKWFVASTKMMVVS